MVRVQFSFRQIYWTPCKAMFFAKIQRVLHPHAYSPRGTAEELTLLRPLSVASPARHKLIKRYLLIMYTTSFLLAVLGPSARQLNLRFFFANWSPKRKLTERKAVTCWQSQHSRIVVTVQDWQGKASWPLQSQGKPSTCYDGMPSCWYDVKVCHRCNSSGIFFHHFNFKNKTLGDNWNISLHVDLILTC